MKPGERVDLTVLCFIYKLRIYTLLIKKKIQNIS